MSTSLLTVPVVTDRLRQDFAVDAPLWLVRLTIDKMFARHVQRLGLVRGVPASSVPSTLWLNRSPVGDRGRLYYQDLGGRPRAAEVFVPWETAPCIDR